MFYTVGRIIHTKDYIIANMINFNFFTYLVIYCNQRRFLYIYLFILICNLVLTKLYTYIELYYTKSK